MTVQLQAKMKWKLRRRGFNALRKSAAADLEARGVRIQQAAGSWSSDPEKHFGVSVSIGRTRPRVYVFTKTDEAKRREATDRVLTRAVDAAR